MRTRRLGVTSRLASRAAAIVAVIGLAAAGPETAAAKNKAKGHVVNGTLVVTGSDAADLLVLRLRAGDPTWVEVDVGADGTWDLAYPREKFDRIDVGARAGDDTVRIDESNGVFTDTERTTLRGESGRDRLLGGRGPELLDGGADPDSLVGGPGSDRLTGSTGDDLVSGGDGDDLALMGDGTDTFTWSPGDDNDSVEGQGGTDRVAFNGSNVAETITVSPNDGRVVVVRNVASVTLDLNDVETVDVIALGGADTITVNDLGGTDLTDVNSHLAVAGGTGDTQPDTVTVNGTSSNDVMDVFGVAGSATVIGPPQRVDLSGVESTLDTLAVHALEASDSVTATSLPAGVVKLALDGHTGDDTLLGSQGADVLAGGDGNDFLFGDNGNDIALMGAGDDVAQWDPGDANDTLEGQAGSDEMRFFGSNAAENIDIAANAGRVRFFRNVANVTTDLDDVERVDFRALGGADNVVAGDLTGTDVTEIGLDLRGPNGGGDGQPDTVTANGTQGADVFGAAGDAGGVNVFGLQAALNVFSPDAANDRLTLNGLGGDDVVDAVALEADGMQLTANGGLGADVILGGAGNDLVNGGDGDDVALTGAGADTFVWNPGDDNDTVEGQDGADTLLFNGSNVAENLSVSANGGRVQFFRDVASVTLDLNDVETFDLNALGGADTITLNDLSGTDLTALNANLAAATGTGDAQADNVILNATAGDDSIVAAGDAAAVSVTGLAAQLDITGAEAAHDRLTINGLAGEDAVEGSDLVAGAIKLTANGGDHDDVLIGGDGDDILTGGDGDDVLIGGPGIDTLDGGNGDDVEIQG